MKGYDLKTRYLQTSVGLTVILGAGHSKTTQYYSSSQQEGNC